MRNITTAVEKLIKAGYTVEDINADAKITITGGDDGWGDFGWMVTDSDFETFATWHAKNGVAPRRNAHSSDPAGYSGPMGARVTHRDNRAGYTMYNGNIQIWD